MPDGSKGAGEADAMAILDAAEKRLRLFLMGRDNE